MKLPVYLDYQATTPVDADVLKAMLPYFSDRFGNAASKSHEFGWTAESAVEKARTQVAELLGASEPEIIFTSGSTESINLAIQGVAHAYSTKGKHLITTQVEHKAVLDTFSALERQGFTTTILSVDASGQVQPSQVEKAIRPDTILISVMTANNEVGTLQPIKAIGQIAKKKNILFHTDATQAAGKIPFDVNELGVDLASISAHKMYGPKGVGALYVRRKNPRVTLEPIIYGGGHEKGIRSGTLNVPGIVRLGEACAMAHREKAKECVRLGKLTDRLRTLLSKELEDISFNGHTTERLPDNLSVCFNNVDSQALMLSIRELAVSGGSACRSTDLEPSHVLKAMGFSTERATTTLRISVGKYTTEKEIDFAAEKLIEKVKEFRKLRKE